MFHISFFSSLHRNLLPYKSHFSHGFEVPVPSCPGRRRGVDTIEQNQGVYDQSTNRTVPPLKIGGIRKGIGKALLVHPPSAFEANHITPSFFSSGQSGSLQQIARSLPQPSEGYFRLPPSILQFD